MVMEKTTPATVIIEPAMVESTSCAPSGLAFWYQPRPSSIPAPGPESSHTIRAPSPIASKAMRLGKNQ